MNLNNILMKLETVKFIMIFIFINFAFSQDIVFITESDDPSAAFGGTDYRTTIFFQDVGNDDIVDFYISIHDIYINDEPNSSLLSVGELNHHANEYYFDVFGSLNDNYDIDLCKFSITISDESTSLEQNQPVNDAEPRTATKEYIFPIITNSKPVPIITLSASSGAAGDTIHLDSDLSFDVNGEDDINYYFWSVQTIKRKESYIDLNKNGQFDSAYIDLNQNGQFDSEDEPEPFNDLNNNGRYDQGFEQEINIDFENITSSSTYIILPQTFEDMDIYVNLQITDDRGAKGYSQESIYTINPKVVLGSNEGDNLQTISIPVNFQNISDERIHSLDLSFNWNYDIYPIPEHVSCSSVDFFPSVISEFISITEPASSNNYQFYINDQEPGKLNFTMFVSDTSLGYLNDLISLDTSFINLNVPLTGFHGESDKIYVSKFSINEKNFGFNSNSDPSSGRLTISGDMINPKAFFKVKDDIGNIINENDSIFSGTELEFEIIRFCDEINNPVSECSSVDHDLAGNGINAQYKIDFDSDGTIDQSGPLNGNVINENVYSITGFENEIKTAKLFVETAYGCDSTQFSVNIQPLVPTIRMTNVGDAFDYGGEPASINLFINQMEDLEALDLEINFDNSFLNIIDIESQINFGVPFNIAANYSFSHNVINNSVYITAYSDSTHNYTFFNENLDYQFASIKFFALQPGETQISITKFDVDERSFLDNLGQDSLTILVSNPNEEGYYDCNLNGVYDEGEEFIDEDNDGIYDEDEEFIDLGELNGTAIIDQCGICSGGSTNIIPNSTQDCLGTCMPTELLANINLDLASEYIVIDEESYSLTCHETSEGFNISSLECETYIGLESSHPLADENGVDLCGICGGNNIYLNDQFIGSNIDCNGFCDDETPNPSDQYGFCGCNNDSDGLYPDIYGYCKDGNLPVQETGLCSDIFDDIDMNGIWNLSGGDSIIEKIDTTDANFSNWGYKYLNYDPNALSDDGSCTRGVVINEFFFSPVQGTSVPDYIELLNMTPFDLDISSWSINNIEIEQVYSGPAPIMPAGKHFLISTGLPFFNLEGQLFFPGDCSLIANCIPNSLSLNINLGMNSGEILIEDYSTMDYLAYSQEAYWPVGAPNIGRSIELIEPYKSRNLSSNWLTASEYYPNPYMATEDGEWNVAGGFNYGTPSTSNNAYNINHSENCNDNINCNLTKYDCDDVFNGLAFYDLCNICSGGSTNNNPSIFNENLGMCTGDENIIDCACTCYTEPNYGAIIDDCGQCTLGNSGSYDPQGNIVVDPVTTLDCIDDNNCTIWGMVCNQDTRLCHHEYNGRMDDCLTCRLGPECNGSENLFCDQYYNVAEEYTDENSNNIYDIGEQFNDINNDGIRNDGLDDCNICTQRVNILYEDTNGDGFITPCYDGIYDEYGNWISNCLDWESAYYGEANCPVDCLGDVNFDGNSDDIIASIDDCGQCIECSSPDCSDEEQWNSTCIYDFDALVDMNAPGIQLNWTPNYEYDFYKIYKDNELFVDSLLFDENSYLDTDVSYPNEYCYHIVAFTQSGEISNPSSTQCRSINYFAEIILENFYINQNINSVGVILNVTDEMDTISFGISDNITIDSLMNGLFDNNWYITELNDNNIKIYSNNPNSSLNGNLELGDILFTRDTTGLDNSFCITEAELIPYYDILFPNGYIAQLPECEYFGCTNENAYNYNENATVDDGSCELPYYFVEIDSSDIFQNILIVADNERLEIGDEIAIYDFSGILTSECPGEFGEVLVGTGLFTGQDLNIRAIGGVQCDVYEQSTNAQPGFIQNNEIIVKVWRNSSQFEYIYSIAEQGHFFGGQDIVVDQFNIPLYYQVDIEDTDNIQTIIFTENLYGLEYGDHIGIFDYNGIGSDDCPAQFDTVLVGSGYYENELLSIEVIGGTPCTPPQLPGGSIYTEPGFIQGNDIIIHIWRDSEQVEYLSIYPENSYIFGEQEVIIQEILTNDKVELPNNYHLYPIFPNPFNPTATIKYDIPQVSNVLIEVFDVRGKKINTLQSGIKQPGIHFIKWTSDYQPSGLYLIRMSSENINFTEKVMLVK